MSVFDPQLGHLFGVSILDTYARSGQGASSGAAQQAYHNAVMQSQLQNQQAFNGIYRPKNMAQPKPSNVTPIRPERTPEEIQAQLEARYAEMEAEAASPAVRFPCKTCKWREEHIWDYCAQPLIMGIKGKPVSRVNDFEGSETTALCGPEKALWEPIPPRWQRFTEWLAKVIERMEGVRG